VNESASKPNSHFSEGMKIKRGKARDLPVTDILKLEKVSKVVGEGDRSINILRGVSLTLHAGEYVAIIGAVRFRKIHTSPYRRIAGYAQPRQG